MKEWTPYRGGEYVLGTTAGGENMHIEFGRVTGATPDGRMDGDPLADSLGAAQGRDRQGVTALLNSVAKLPHSLLPTATTLNVKLDPKLLADESAIDKIATLIEGHFRSGRAAMPVQPGQPGDAAGGKALPGEAWRPDGARDRVQRPVHLSVDGPAGRDHCPDRTRALRPLLQDITFKEGILL